MPAVARRSGGPSWILRLGPANQLKNFLRLPTHRRQNLAALDRMKLLEVLISVLPVVRRRDFSQHGFINAPEHTTQQVVNLL